MLFANDIVLVDETRKEIISIIECSREALDTFNKTKSENMNVTLANLGEMGF